MFEMPRQNYLQSGESLERREGRLKRKRKLKTVITFVTTVRFLHPSFNTRFTSRPIGSQSFMMIALKLWPPSCAQKCRYLNVVRDAKSGHFY